LDLQGNNVDRLPPDIGGLGALVKIFLQRNQLKELPPEFEMLNSLKELDLSYNKFQAFPEILAFNRTLKVLNLKANGLAGPLPPVLGKLNDLVQLDLSLNRITALPNEIGACRALKELSLSANKIRYIPESFVKLRSLRSVDFYHNKIEKVPLHFFELTWVRHVNFLRNPTRDFQVVSKEDNWHAMAEAHRYYPFAVREWRRGGDEYNAGRLRVDDFLQRVAQRMAEGQGPHLAKALGEGAASRVARPGWDPARWEALAGFFFVRAHATRVSPAFDFMCRQTM